MSSTYNVAVLGYGTAPLGKIKFMDAPLIHKSARLLNHAIDRGITYLDTSPDYGSQPKLGEVLKSMGHSLEQDPKMKRAINQFARRAVAGMAASYGGSIVKLVSETVRGWDAQTITNRLESAVGRDLQYIRINGTLVGGLVGLVLHALDML